MREIKYRGWNGRSMFNIDVMAISPCTWDCPDHNRKGVSLAYQPSIKVMQFTGWKDKNGKEVYEGDVLDCNAGAAVVFYSEKFLAWKLRFMTPFENEQPLYLWNEDGFVIGNIYENPELLKIK